MKRRCKDRFNSYHIRQKFILNRKSVVNIMSYEYLITFSRKMKSLIITTPKNGASL